MSQTAVEKNKKNTIVEELYDWVETFVMALVAVVLIFTFLFRIVAVDGDSMNQTLKDRDSLVITNVVKPKIGDIVVFQEIDDHTAPLIKRVIATEGQTVDISVNADDRTLIVTVDGKIIDEPYTYYDPTREMFAFIKPKIELPYTVEPGHVFVMGDNRRNSADSRSFGAVDERNIIGKVLLRLTPLDKFGVINTVQE